MLLHFRALIAVVVLLAAYPALAQDETGYMSVDDIVITLKNGTVIQVGPDDTYSISYDEISTTVSLKQAGSPRTVDYDASDMACLTFTRNGVPDTCLSRQIDKKKWVMLSTLASGEKADLYTSPKIGAFRYHYIRKAESPFCTLVSNQATQFPKSLKDCPDVVNFYLSKSKAAAPDALPDSKLIEIIGVYNTCGQSKTLN